MALVILFFAAAAAAAARPVPHPYKFVQNLRTGGLIPGDTQRPIAVPRNIGADYAIDIWNSTAARDAFRTYGSSLKSKASWILASLWQAVVAGDR